MGREGGRGERWRTREENGERERIEEEGIKKRK